MKLAVQQNPQFCTDVLTVLKTASMISEISGKNYTIFPWFLALNFWQFAFFLYKKDTKFEDNFYCTKIEDLRQSTFTD